MVSLRKLESEQIIESKPRNSIDWEHIRGVTIGRLRRMGFDVDRAEELTQAAVVSVYAGNERISDKRALKDVWSECFGILHAEAEDRAKLAAASLPDDVGSSRHVDQRSPMEAKTVQTRNAFADRREYRELCVLYAVREDGVSLCFEQTHARLYHDHPKEHGMVVECRKDFASVYFV